LIPALKIMSITAKTNISAVGSKVQQQIKVITESISSKNMFLRAKNEPE